MRAPVQQGGVPTFTRALAPASAATRPDVSSRSVLALLLAASLHCLICALPLGLPLGARPGPHSADGCLASLRLSLEAGTSSAGDEQAFHSLGTIQVEKLWFLAGPQEEDTKDDKSTFYALCSRTFQPAAMPRSTAVGGHS